MVLSAIRVCFSCLWCLVFITGYQPEGRAESSLFNMWRGEAVQGGLLVFQLPAGYQAYIDGTYAEISESGIFVIGFHRDDKAAISVDAVNSDGDIVERLSITPRLRSYDIQRIDNLPRAMVSPDENIMDRIRQDSRDVRAARAEFSELTDALMNGFDWPLSGRITGVYGSQRILNGQPRQPHYGIDIAAPKGLAVRSSANGIIRLAKSLYFTGATVIIDHGFGLSSTYSHLDSLSVSEGQHVKRGEIIGTVGSTGRSTGPHLDWRINWKSKRLDPILVSKQRPIPSPRPRPSG